MDSAPGKGTRFVIMIPVAEGETAIKEEGKKQETNRGKSELVLIVEDDPSISDLTGKIVEKMGYTVLLADSADRAMTMIEDEGLRPDLVVSDVVMPGLSGLELAAILRFKHPDMKLLLMSGYTESIITKHGDLDPNIPFIQKPFTRSELADKIRQALEA